VCELELVRCKLGIEKVVSGVLWWRLGNQMETFWHLCQYLAFHASIPTEVQDLTNTPGGQNQVKPSHIVLHCPAIRKCVAHFNFTAIELRLLVVCATVVLRFYFVNLAQPILVVPS
jgi:hypothetical protein